MKLKSHLFWLNLKHVIWWNEQTFDSKYNKCHQLSVTNMVRKRAENNMENLTQLNISFEEFQNPQSQPRPQNADST